MTLDGFYLFSILIFTIKCTLINSQIKQSIRILYYTIKPFYIIGKVWFFNITADFKDVNILQKIVLFALFLPYNTFTFYLNKPCHKKHLPQQQNNLTYNMLLFTKSLKYKVTFN